MRPNLSSPLKPVRKRTMHMETHAAMNRIQLPRRDISQDERPRGEWKMKSAEAIMKYESILTHIHPSEEKVLVEEEEDERRNIRE